MQERNLLSARPRSPSVTPSLRKSHHHNDYEEDDTASDTSESSRSDDDQDREDTTQGPHSSRVVIVSLVLLLCIASVAAFYFWNEHRKSSSETPSSPSSSQASSKTFGFTTSRTILSDTTSTTQTSTPSQSSSSSASKPPLTGTSSSSPTNASPSSKSSSTPNPTSSIVPKDLVDILLKTHNDFRVLHQVEPLDWNETLAESSDRWVDHCVFEHSGGKLLEGGYGENLFASSGTGSTEDTPVDGKAGVDSWNDEIKMYTYSPPTGFTHETGHVTQTLWKGTKTVGCQFKNCKGLFTVGQWGSYLVCQYYPPGNYEGQYEENVLPPKG